MTLDLFGDDESPPSEPVDDPGTAPGAPLADRLRPRSLSEVVGQEHLTGPGRLLSRVDDGSLPPSLVFWGPPGTGKTTLARLVARAANARYAGLSAVTAGVKEIRAVVAAAREARRGGRATVLFLDEIHRFNKAQQDALLPHVESGVLTLLGATTENPSFEVNAALLSRCRVVRTRPLDEAALGELATRALSDPERGLGVGRPVLADEARTLLVRSADGDARRLLNALETAVELAGGSVVEVDHAAEALATGVHRYDRAGEAHFDQISALQKSVRASDPHGAVYWCRRMLQAGEDPLYIARRLVRMAVEDVGLADPRGLEQAVAARSAVSFLGRPEGDLALLQAAVFLALAPKSNALETAQLDADRIIAGTGSLEVPLHFRNAPTELLRSLGYGREYRYDHDAPGGFAGQSGLPDELAGTRLYRPTDRGGEAELGSRLERLDAARDRAAAESGGQEKAPPSGEDGA